MATMTTESEWEHVSLVPRRRLGALLSSARVERGMTLDEVASQASQWFSTATLASIERGTRECTDAELRALSELYSLEATSLVPARSKLVIDLDEGVLAVEDRRTRIRGSFDRDEVLSRYLAMVYSMRHLEPGTQIPLRVDDLDVLGKALRVGTQTLESDLASLMSNPRDAIGWRTRVLRRKVLIPAAGVLVAVCGVGALVLVATDGSPASPFSTHAIGATSALSTGPAQIGSAVVQSRSADGTPGAVETRGGASTVGVEIIDPLVQER